MAEAAAAAEGLWGAVTEVVKPIIESGREVEYDEEKLGQKLRTYFKKGAKQLEFYSKAFPQLVNEYTDSVFGSIWQGLGDRDWLPEVDFLFCIDAGIKENFPRKVVASIPPAAFEQIVLQASDRASDEQRYFAIRWETLNKAIPSKTTAKKVREALDTSRAAAVQAGAETPDAFAEKWVNNFVRTLATSYHGDPTTLLEESAANDVFQALVVDGCLPAALTKDVSLPAPWPALQAFVTQAYASKGGPAPARGRGTYGTAAVSGLGGGIKATRTTYGTTAPSAAELVAATAFFDEPPAKRWKGSGKGNGKGWGWGKW